jgi:hypothetical protein
MTKVLFVNVCICKKEIVNKQHEYLYPSLVPKITGSFTGRYSCSLEVLFVFHFDAIEASVFVCTNV